MSKFSNITTSFSPPRSLPRTPLTPTSTLSDAMIEETIETAGSLIAKWNPSDATSAAATTLFRSNDKQDAYEFITSVASLRRTMVSLLPSAAAAASRNLRLSHTLLQLAMKRLEREFYLILAAHRSRLVDLVADGSGEEVVSTVDVGDLQCIADCMICCGYGKECLKVYTVIRKSAVDEAMYRVGIKQLRSSSSTKSHNMNWCALEQRIPAWIETCKVTMKTIFQREKILCDRVFSASDAIRDSSFAIISKEAAADLFEFPELIAGKRKNSPENIFRLLDLHEAISDLLPDFDSIFSSESSSPERLRAHESLRKLGDAIVITIADFKSSIQKDSSKTLVAGGGIHPLTRKAMEFLGRLAEYSGALTEIFAGPVQLSAATVSSPVPDYFFSSPSMMEESPATKAVAEKVAWLILVLLCKLDVKAELHKDVSLSYLFLANNLNYIVREVRTTSLRHLLGSSWICKHGAKVKQYAVSYEMTAWAGILEELPAADSPDLTPEVATETVKRFCAAIEEACKKHASWIVVEKELRDEIRVSISRNIVPAYREFYEANAGKLRGENDLELFYRFAPENLENSLSGLFLPGLCREISSDSSLSSSTSSSSSNIKVRSPKQQ